MANLTNVLYIYYNNNNKQLMGMAFFMWMSHQLYFKKKIQLWLRTVNKTWYMCKCKTYFVYRYIFEKENIN